MPRFTSLINNFTAGVFSPLLYGRSDFAGYSAAARSIVNFIVLPYGGITRRPGFRYIAEVKDSSKYARLIPFEFSTTQSYIIELGDQYMRFYMDKGQILSGGVPYEITTPYNEADLEEIQFAQNADIMWIVHPRYPPKKLSRYGHTDWRLEDYTPTNNPFTTPTWQASKAYKIDNKVVPTVSNNYYYKCITAGTSGTTEPSWPTNIGDTVNDGSVVWRCTGNTPADYPSCVTFYEQRLWFASTYDEPQKMWASKSGNYEDMTTGTNDDDALQYTIASNQVNAIRFLSAGKVLVAGTTGGDFIVGSSSAEPITPTNITVRRETNSGSAYIMPVRIGNYMFYVERGSKRLRQLSYSFDEDSHISLNMSILSEHLTSTGITNIAYTSLPYSIIWVLLKDGRLLSFTRDVTQKVSAWTEHNTDGSFESISTIITQSGYELWVVVKRTINGITKRYVEVLAPYDFANQNDAFFVDSGLTYDGTPTTTITNLDHLEGKSVSILADGAVQPNKTVQGGQITLDYPASKVQAGLAYKSELETLPQEGGSAIGTAQGKIQRIYKIALNLYQTLGGFVGNDELFFRDSSAPMGQAVPLFNGFKIISPPKGYDRELTVKIEQTQPLPMTIRALVLFMETYDE